MAIWVSITKKGTKKQNFFLLKQLTMHKQDTNSFLKQLKIYNKFLSDFQQMADQSSALFVYLKFSQWKIVCEGFPLSLSAEEVPGTGYEKAPSWWGCRRKGWTFPTLMTFNSSLLQIFKYFCLKVQPSSQTIWQNNKIQRTRNLGRERNEG